MKLTSYIRTIGITIVMMFSFFSVFSQNNANKGDRYFDKNLFQEAIKYYRLEAKSGNRRYSNYAKQRLAACYRILGEFEMAEDMHRKLLKSKRNREDPIYYLNYGKSLKSSAKYAEAKFQFNEYIRLNPGDPMGKIFLHSCDSAQKWLEETIGKEVKNIEKINTSLSDFAPVILASNQLVFSSSREGSKEAFISFDGGMKVNRLDLYYTDLNSLAGKESVVYSNFSEINSPLHEGSATFSSDGKEIYFTRTIKGKKTKKGNKNEILSTLQVFYSVIDSSGHWSEPVSAFTFNSAKYSIGQPSLSKDGEKIFFISDMKGGYGSTDIYYSEKREDGTWVEPINAGSEVNTFGHELFPYISDNGTLYFSSDSHIGMGKLDIFSSILKKDEWTNVQNLKPPFNSIGNDFGIVFDGYHSRGFFSSDRFNGKGAEDIYSFSESISPIEITLNGNKIQFPDKNIFDGLKYVLKNEITKKDTVLQSVNGMYSYTLKLNDNYTLVAKKNRFSVHNKIAIQVKRDTLSNYLEAKIKSGSHVFKINGYLTYNSKSDTTKTVQSPLKNIPVIVKNATTTLAKINTGSTGYFSFDIDLNPNEEYTVLACKNDCETVLIPKPEKKDTEMNNQNNNTLKVDAVENVVIQLTGILKDENGVIGNAKIVIYDGNQVVGEVKTTSKGEFSYPLFPPKYKTRLLIITNKHSLKEVVLPINSKTIQNINKEIFLNLK